MTSKEPQYFAEDIYKKWLYQVKRAESTIDVISPYVSNTVKDLLTSKHISREVSRSIYTRIDSDTIFDQPWQIRALINCIKSGIDVYHIPLLHAKHLIIDGWDITIGSQNFTKRGRKNKESTVLTFGHRTWSKFSKTLDEWMEEAVPIRLSYLIELEKKLSPLREDIKRLRKFHQLKFDEIEPQREIDEIINRVKKNLRALRAKSKITFASESIVVSRDYSHHGTPIYRPKGDCDMLNWNVAGSAEPYNLGWLEYYPMINTMTCEIKYVRMGHTQFSQCGDSINFGSIELSGRKYLLNATCPSENTFDVNYIINVTNEFGWTSEIHYFFNGLSFELRQTVFHDTAEETFLLNNVIHDETQTFKLLSTPFQGVSLNALWQNIKSFLKEDQYNLTLGEIYGNSIIIAEPIESFR